MRLTGLLLALLCSLSAYCQHRVYDIRRYGARGDGKSDNTLFIQKAIDDATARGGGTVLVPAGKFLSGALTLKSNVNLHLAADAVLLGSTKRTDYGLHNALPLLMADGQDHISITGRGTIDGQGEALLKDIYKRLKAGTMQDAEWQKPNPWHQVRPSEENRPKIIGFTRCDSVTVKGITLKHALDWVEDYKSCSHVTIDSIRVESNTFWNNDGIDLVDCKNVKVTNSFFNADDDGICLKSEKRNDSCLNIYVAHCTVRSSASAIKLGTAGRGGFRHITIRDITVYDTYRSAIALECVDGGRMEDVDIRNVKATNTGNAIFIRLGHRNKDSVVSSIRHIYIGNVTVDVPGGKPDKGYPMEGPPLPYSHNVFPSSIVGLPGHPVEDVVLENIQIIYPGGGKKLTVPDNPFPENPSDYPEFSMFGELPSWALFVRHARGLTLKNVRVTVKQKDYRPACAFDDVSGLVLSGIQTN
jgi:polygalacturonase